METLRFIWRDLLECLLRGRWSLRGEVESLRGDLRVALGQVEGREVDRVEDEREEWRERTALLEHRRGQRRRHSLFRGRARRRKEASPDFQFGQIHPASVVGVLHDCIRVRIDGRDWRVHLPEFHWGDIGHPSQVLSVGREVRVKVLSVPTDARHPFLILI